MGKVTIGLEVSNPETMSPPIGVLEILGLPSISQPAITEGRPIIPILPKGVYLMVMGVTIDEVLPTPYEIGFSVMLTRSPAVDKEYLPDGKRPIPLLLVRPPSVYSLLFLVYIFGIM